MDKERYMAIATEIREDINNDAGEAAIFVVNTKDGGGVLVRGKESMLREALAKAMIRDKNFRDLVTEGEKIMLEYIKEHT